MSDLVLYIRQGCHLCDAFLEELNDFDADILKNVRLIDVDEQPGDRQQFGDKVPLLLADGAEICRYYFDAKKMNSCLKL